MRTPEMHCDRLCHAVGGATSVAIVQRRFDMDADIGIDVAGAGRE
jgi:hypothetical protein